MKQYDYIIAGAGAAGLMLADAMGSDPFFSDSKILLIDKDLKNVNDRTWCFWEKGEGRYEEIIHKAWPLIAVKGNDLDKREDISPYTYKMVRGLDFYSYHLGRISNYSNVSYLTAEILEVLESPDGIVVKTGNGEYRSLYLFNSLYNPSKPTGQKKYPLIHQHFRGWFIKFEKPVFDDRVALFMDFGIPQLGNTRFMYVLPFSNNEALLEYTLFSGALLDKEEYEQGIGDYLDTRFEGVGYKVMEKEAGVIPMTCFNFEAANTSRIMHIGTAGGWSKPSTGFTFRNTIRNTHSLIEHIKSGKSFDKFKTKRRFFLYDILLIDILHHSNEKGPEIFLSMFRKRKAKLVLKFLDEETNFWEDLRIIAACPKRLFLKALFRRIF